MLAVLQSVEAAIGAQLSRSEDILKFLRQRGEKVED